MKAVLANDLRTGWHLQVGTQEESYDQTEILDWVTDTANGATSVLYIRLEDMIVITDTKAEILSDFVPWDIAGIEKLMAEDGMLQRYPRDEANHN